MRDVVSLGYQSVAWDVLFREGVLIRGFLGTKIEKDDFEGLTGDTD